MSSLVPANQPDKEGLVIALMEVENEAGRIYYIEPEEYRLVAERNTSIVLKGATGLGKLAGGGVMLLAAFGLIELELFLLGLFIALGSYFGGNSVDVLVSFAFTKLNERLQAGKPIKRKTVELPSAMNELEALAATYDSEIQLRLLPDSRLKVVFSAPSDQGLARLLEDKELG
jgi:hypothetical protein